MCMSFNYVYVKVPTEARTTESSQTGVSIFYELTYKGGPRS